ncbi:hypothetical protein COL154_014188, partial [Colletotrichum chrysophilum]
RGIETCIISTAQQARPNVIHISEPVRAQVINSSADVTRKPLSASSAFTSVKNASSLPTGLPVFASVPYYRGPRDDVIDRKRNLQWIAIVIAVFVAYFGLYLIRILSHS